MNPKSTFKQRAKNKPKGVYEFQVGISKAIQSEKKKKKQLNMINSDL